MSLFSMLSSASKAPKHSLNTLYNLFHVMDNENPLKKRIIYDYKTYLQSQSPYSVINSEHVNFESKEFKRWINSKWKLRDGSKRVQPFISGTAKGVKRRRRKSTKKRKPRKKKSVKKRKGKSKKKRVRRKRKSRRRS